MTREERQAEVHVWVAPDGAPDTYTGTTRAFLLRQAPGLHLGTHAEVQALDPAALAVRIAQVRQEYAGLPF